MNPSVKNLWIEALRSGEYNQGKDYLTYDDGDTTRFCCLGVLCDVAVKAGVDVLVGYYSKDFDTGEVFDYDGDPVLLPASVTKWAGQEARDA